MNMGTLDHDTPVSSYVLNYVISYGETAALEDEIEIVFEYSESEITIETTDLRNLKNIYTDYSCQLYVSLLRHHSC